MSLRLDQDRYHEFYDEMDGGICIIQADESEQILFVNRTVPELYGCRDEAEFYERTGGTFAGMTKESDREPLSLHVVRGARYSTWYYQIPEAGGAIRPAQMLITCAVRENTPVYLCQIFTEAMHKASLMSDGLTGLPGVKEFTASSLDLLRAKRGGEDPRGLVLPLLQHHQLPLLQPRLRRGGWGSLHQKDRGDPPGLLSGWLYRTPLSGQLCGDRAQNGGECRHQEGDGRDPGRHPQ